MEVLFVSTSVVALAEIGDKTKEGKGNFGHNAQTGEYGDMIEFGILDPTKVTRTELRAACARAHTAVRPGAGALPGFHCAR